MRLFDSPLSRPLAILALAHTVSCVLLTSPVRAAGFRDRVRQCPVPPADSAGSADPRAFADAVEWGGRIFLHFDMRTWWTADTGRTWKSHGWILDTPKGPVPVLEAGWFTSTRPALYLGNRSGDLGYVFDAAADDWKPFEAGSDPAAPPGATVAAGGDGERLYALSADHALRATGDAGVTWSAVPLPDSVRVGTWFDDLQAEGPRLLLRNRDASSVQRAAASLDGGATWFWLAPHAAVILSRGCAHAFLHATLETRCPGAAVASSGGAPFEKAQALFSDGAGTLFAWADSALYSGKPDPPGWHWDRIAGKEELRGWSYERDLLFRMDSGRVEWFSPSHGAASGMRPPAARRGPHLRRYASPPAWIQTGRRPDGRSVKARIRAN
ncbi:MAG: hypothetical protein JWP91_1480 [Fibrobacteres bacterium]|nr:hypothetical protein [Fibrobacterota bacterium]